MLSLVMSVTKSPLVYCYISNVDEISPSYYLLLMKTRKCSENFKLICWMGWCMDYGYELVFFSFPAVVKCYIDFHVYHWSGMGNPGVAHVNIYLLESLKVARKEWHTICSNSFQMQSMKFVLSLLFDCWCFPSYTFNHYSTPWR